MGRTRIFDMEEAIGTATKLFWRGYDRTSLTELTGALGIGAASFYFAFESKEALFRQVMDRYISRLDQAYAFPVPAMFVIDADGIIRFAHVEVDYLTGRAKPEEIVAALKAIVQPVAH